MSEQVCDAFLDEDDVGCEMADGQDHCCVLSPGHIGAHECDCGVTW